MIQNLSKEETTNYSAFQQKILTHFKQEFDLRNQLKDLQIQKERLSQDQIKAKLNQQFEYDIDFTENMRES
tara:strand:+ start:294 stop:506 length:213 start_codon:yes stop_codon:yes gene_type:complete